MEHQTPSGFPGNFRKRKVLGTLWFPSGLPETLVQAKVLGTRGDEYRWPSANSFSSTIMDRLELCCGIYAAGSLRLDACRSGDGSDGGDFPKWDFIPSSASVSRG